MKSSLLASPRWACCSFCIFLAVCLFLVCPGARAEVDEGFHILLLADGSYQQESEIYYHLLEQGYEITVNEGGTINADTDLSPYDLILVSGFDLSLTLVGIAAIKSSELPVLLVEPWQFWLSWAFGLVHFPLGWHFRTDQVELVDAEHQITSGFDEIIEVYQSGPCQFGEKQACGGRCCHQPTTIGIDPWLVKDHVKLLVYAAPGHDEVTVFADDERKIVATGIWDTHSYSEKGWELFDRMIGWFQPVSVEQAWSATPENAAIFVKLVSTPQEDLLGYTSFGDVKRLSRTGEMWSVLDYPEDDIPPYQIVLNPEGNGFWVTEGTSVTLYRSDGTLVGTLSVEGAGLAKPVSGTELISLPLIDEGSVSIESGPAVIGGRLMNISGQVQAEFLAGGIQRMMITASRALYMTGKEIVLFDLEQNADLWRTDHEVESFAASVPAESIIGEDRLDNRRVVHLGHGAEISVTELGSVVWDVAISPSGEYSAATTQQAVHIFHQGELYTSKPVALAFTSTVDVSNNGEVLVGGKDAESTPHLILLSRYGEILWQGSSGEADPYGWRPDVSFQLGGEAFTSRTRSGVAFFEIERGW